MVSGALAHPAWAWCPGGQLVQINEFQNVNVGLTAGAQISPDVSLFPYLAGSDFASRGNLALAWTTLGGAGNPDVLYVRVVDGCSAGFPGTNEVAFAVDPSVPPWVGLTPDPLFVQWPKVAALGDAPVGDPAAFVVVYNRSVNAAGQELWVQGFFELDAADCVGLDPLSACVCAGTGANVTCYAPAFPSTLERVMPQQIGPVAIDNRPDCVNIAQCAPQCTAGVPNAIGTPIGGCNYPVVGSNYNVAPLAADAQNEFHFAVVWEQGDTASWVLMNAFELVDTGVGTGIAPLFVDTVSGPAPAIPAQRLESTAWTGLQPAQTFDRDPEIAPVYAHDLTAFVVTWYSHDLRAWSPASDVAFAIFTMPPPAPGVLWTPVAEDGVVNLSGGVPFACALPMSNSYWGPAPAVASGGMMNAAIAEPGEIWLLWDTNSYVCGFIPGVEGWFKDIYGRQVLWRPWATPDLLAWFVPGSSGNHGRINNDIILYDAAPTAAGDPAYVAVAWNKTSYEEVSHQQFTTGPSPNMLGAQDRLPRVVASPPPYPSRQNRPMLEPIPTAMGLWAFLSGDLAHFIAIWDTLDQVRQDAGQGTEINFGIW